jgi:hypothetical protein
MARDFRSALTRVQGAGTLVQKLDKGSLTPSDISDILGNILDAKNTSRKKSSSGDWATLVNLYLLLVPTKDTKAYGLDLKHAGLKQIDSMLGSEKPTPDSRKHFAENAPSIRTHKAPEYPQYVLFPSGMIFEGFRMDGGDQKIGVREMFSGKAAAPATHMVIALRGAHSAYGEAQKAAGNNAPPLAALVGIARKFRTVVDLVAQNVKPGTLEVTDDSFASTFELTVYADASARYQEAIVQIAETLTRSRAEDLSALQPDDLEFVKQLMQQLVNANRRKPI